MNCCSEEESNPDRCMLCPRECGADRRVGKRGVCGASDEVVVARACLHLWEEPPITGPFGSGTVFFSHCPLQCVYCQNRAISGRRSGRAVDTDELAAICLSLQDSRAANINFVTPTHYAPHIRKAIEEARKDGLDLPVVWNTSGYEKTSSIIENEGFVDIYLSDFKYADPKLGRDLSGIPDYPQVALCALDEMVSHVGEARYDDFEGEKRMLRGVIVRHLVLPGHVDDSKRVVSLIHERFGSAVRMSIMNQYTPVIADAAESGDARAGRCLSRYPEFSRRLLASEYEEVLDFADSIGMEDYFWQDGETASESFIPDFEGSGIDLIVES